MSTPFSKTKSKTFLRKTLASHYCQIVFVLALIAGYLLVPRTVFLDRYATGLVAVFLFSFALSLMCLVRVVKERIVQAKTYKSSLIGIVATAVGMTALQACGIGAPVCGASIGGGILGMIFPAFAVSFLRSYAPYILGFSIIMQLASLRFMNCFRRSS